MTIHSYDGNGTRKIEIFPGRNIEINNDYVRISLPPLSPVLSSAVLNGGYCQVSEILNLKVDQNYHGLKYNFSEPDDYLEEYARERGWGNPVTGMMTAAWMTSFRAFRRTECGANVAAIVTAGVSNAKRAGEPAEYRSLEAKPEKAGTVNIITLTDAVLSPAAMAEAIIVITEAKAAVFQDLNITNPLTGVPATGTGTDSVAIAAGTHGLENKYCGKHTLLGEMLAETLITALTASIKAWIVHRRQE